MTLPERFPRVLVALIVGLAVLNALAIEYAWYWTLRWFDMPMHFLGGVWLGLSFLWLMRGNFSEASSRTLLRSCVYAVGAALLVGIAWEVYESLVSFVASGEIHDLIDTASDLCFDMLGGVVAGIYAWLIYK